MGEGFAQRSFRDCIIANVIAHVKSARAWMSCKIFTFTTGIVRTSAERSPYRPSASYRTCYLTRDLYLLSRISARIFSREEHAAPLPGTSGQRIIAEWAVTSETRCATARRGIFSCKFNAPHRPSTRRLCKKVHAIASLREKALQI